MHKELAGSDEFRTEKLLRQFIVPTLCLALFSLSVSLDLVTDLPALPDASWRQSREFTFELSRNQLLGLPTQLLLGFPVPVDDTLPTPHAPIVIDGNANLTATASAEEWPGQGSTEDPFVIAGLKIDVGGDTRSCLNISNTDLHLVIRDCLLTDTFWGEGVYWAGIYLHNVSHVVVERVKANRCSFGFNMISCHNITLHNCQASNNFWGIGALYGAFLTLVTCQAHYNHGTGFHWYTPNSVLDSCRATQNHIGFSNSKDNVTFTNCISGGNTFGFYITDCEFCNISHCTITNNKNAFNLLFTSNCVISSCTIKYNYGDGLWVHTDGRYEWGGGNNTVTGNAFISNGAYTNGYYNQVFDWEAQTIGVNTSAATNVFAGNYFSEWTTPDADSDGIVDKAYPIRGDAGPPPFHNTTYDYTPTTRPFWELNESKTTSFESTTSSVSNSLTPDFLSGGILFGFAVMILALRRRGKK